MQVVDAVFFELRSFLGHGPTRWITIEWVCLVDRLCRVMDRVQYFAPDKLKFKAYINPNHHPRHTSPHFHFFFLLIIFPHTTPLFASGFFCGSSCTCFTGNENINSFVHSHGIPIIKSYVYVFSLSLFLFPKHSEIIYCVNIIMVWCFFSGIRILQLIHPLRPKARWQINK